MRKTHFRVGISFPVRFFAFIKMEIRANYVTNGKFQSMLEVRSKEMILNNPGGFDQLAEKIQIFLLIPIRVLHYRYVCFINNQK